MKTGWTRELYDVEDVLGLWSRLPFVDLGEAALTIDAIQRTHYWRGLVPESPVPILCERAKTYNEVTGTKERRVRRTRAGFLITFGLGYLTGGMLFHELAHIPSYLSSREHGRKFLNAYLTIWRYNSRDVLYRKIVAELEARGVPVA